MNQNNQPNSVRLDYVQSPNSNVEALAENLQKETSTTRIVKHLGNSFEAKKSIMNVTKCLGNMQEAEHRNEQKRKRNSADSGREYTKEDCLSEDGTRLYTRYNHHSNKENEGSLKNYVNTVMHQSNFKCDTISTLCPYMSFETANYSDAMQNVNHLETEETEREIDHNHLHRTKTNKSTTNSSQEECMNEKFNKEYLTNFCKENQQECQNKQEEISDWEQDHSSLISATENSVDMKKKASTDKDTDTNTNEECPLIDINEDLVDDILNSQDIKIIRKTKIYKKKIKSSRKKGRIYQVRVRGKRCWRAEWYEPQRVVLKESEQLDEKGNIIKKSNSQQKNDIHTEHEESGYTESTRIEEYYIKKSKQFSVSVYTPENARFFAIVALIINEALPNNRLKQEAKEGILDLNRKIKLSRPGKAREEMRRVVNYLEFKKNLILKGSKNSSEPSNSFMQFGNLYNYEAKGKGSSRLLKRNNHKSKKGKWCLQKKSGALNCISLKNKNIASALQEYDKDYLDSKKLNEAMLEHRKTQRNNNHFTSEICTNDSDEMNKHPYNNAYMQNFMYNTEYPLVQRQQNAMDCFSSGRMNDHQNVSFDTNYQNMRQEDASYYGNNNINHTVTNNTTNNNNSVIPYINNHLSQNASYDSQNTNVEPFVSPSYMRNNVEPFHQLGNFQFMLNQNNDNTNYRNYTNSMSYPHNPNFSNRLNMDFQKSMENKCVLRRLKPDFPFDSHPNDNETNYPTQPCFYNQPMEMNSVYGESVENEDCFSNPSSYIHKDNDNCFIYNNQNQNWAPLANPPYHHDISSLNEIVQNHMNFSNEYNQNNNNYTYTNHYFQQ